MPFIGKNMPKLAPAVAIIVFLLAGALLIQDYRYQINNDGIGYIRMAQHYSSEGFYDAFSFHIDHFSHLCPLYPWLLVPFVKTGMNPQFSVKLLSILIGIFTIAGIRMLSYRVELLQWVRDLVLLASVPMVLYFALSMITPDFLLTTILIYYFAFLFDPGYSTSPVYGAICGVIAGIAFWCKSYALVFFIVHFLLFNILFMLRDKAGGRRRKILGGLAAGMLLFMAVSSGWIALLSHEYGYPTLGPASSFNFNLVGPDSPGWDDWKNIKPWSPLDSYSSFVYFINLGAKNALSILNLESLYLSVMALLAGAMYLAGRRIPLNGDVKNFLITAALYPAGYVLFTIDYRYYWPIHFLMVIIIAYLLSTLFSAPGARGGKAAAPYRRALAGIVLSVVLLSLVAVPAMELFNYEASGKYRYMEIYDNANLLKSQYGIRGNISASDMYESYWYSYYMDTSFYILPTRNVTREQLSRNLDDNDIDYYICLDDYWWKLSPDKLSNYTEVTGGQVKGLKVYSTT